MGGPANRTRRCYAGCVPGIASRRTRARGIPATCQRKWRASQEKVVLKMWFMFQQGKEDLTLREPCAKLSRLAGASATVAGDLVGIEERPPVVDRGRLAVDRPRVSVVIPALNEAQNLPYVLPRIPRWVDEVLLVDGHSTDGTIELARKLYPG